MKNKGYDLFIATRKIASVVRKLPYPQFQD